MKLYELTEQYNALLAQMEEVEDLELLAETMESIADAMEAKIENIVKLWKAKATEAMAVRTERDRLELREKRIKKEADWLHSYVEAQMKQAGIDKVPSKLFNIVLKLNPPSVNVLDAAAIPADYIRTTVTTAPDKRTILERLKAGQEIPGVALKQDKVLSIK